MFTLCRENLIAIVIEIAIVIVIEIVIAIVIVIVIERLYRKLVVSRKRVFDD
jgi:hypothetical protein